MPREIARSLPLASFLACVALCIGCQQHDGDEAVDPSSQSSREAAPAGPGSDAGDSTEYVPISPADIDCSLEDFYYNAKIKGGEAIPTGGEIGRFLCGGKEIPLASKEFEDGFIVTRDFGRIKVTFSSSLTESGFGILATERQRRDLKKYVEQ